MNQSEILQKAIENGIIDLCTIQIELDMNERKKFLEKHENNIWQGRDNKWYTYLPDITKSNNRRKIKKNTKEQLEDYIIDFYKRNEHEITIKDLFYLWINKKVDYGEIQVQTKDKYERDFQRYLADIQHRKVSYLTEEELEDYIRTTIREKELTAKAWSGFRTLLNGMFKMARKKGYSKINISNFMSELDLSKRAFAVTRKNPEDNIFTEKEISMIIDFISKNPTLNGYGVLIAIYTGMRAGEIVSLKHEDIFRDYIYVHRTQVRYMDNGKNIYEIKDHTKTDAGTRKVAITEKLRKVLVKLRAENMDNEYLFYDKKRDCIKTIHSLTSHLYAICRQIGIPERSMHCLRKTYATRLINSGVDESIIISQMGHTEIDTTKAYYYYNDKSMEQISNKLEKIINF